MDIVKLLNKFIKEEVESNKVTLYNEAGFQFDFGYYLKYNIENVSLEFDRNIIELGLDKTSDSFHKSEIDILINKKIAVEIKFPNKGAYPKRTYLAIQDVCFLEKIKKHKSITNGYVIFFTPLKNFFDTSLKTEGVYRYFRKDRIISSIPKKYVKSYMNTDYKAINLEKKYRIDLKEVINNNTIYYYYIIKI